MTITNHVIAGSIIGLTVKEPILAITIAFASHFVMDMLPHFGYPGRKGYPEVLKHRLSYIVGFISFFSTLWVIFILMTNNLWFPLICGVAAASPDVAGLYNYLAYEKKGGSAKGMLKLLHVQFHRRIQRFERPWGIYVEIVGFIILLLLLVSFL